MTIIIIIIVPLLNFNNYIDDRVVPEFLVVRNSYC